MKHSERIAVSSYLASYNDKLSYDQIKDCIMDGHESVSIWEPFELYQPEQIIEFIDILQYQIAEVFENKAKVF